MLYNIYLPIYCSPILQPIYLYIGPTNFIQNGLQGETRYKLDWCTFIHTSLILRYWVDCALVVDSLCTNGLLSFLWTISMHYLHWFLIPRFILVLVVAIYWIHVLINPLLNLCIRVSCNRMGKIREGKVTTTTAREKPWVNLWKRNLSVGRQAGSKEAWGLLCKVCMCVWRCVGIYICWS